ncbi:MAG: hypothetical protein QOI92_1316 [Chloroflexota bacterium]|nr:hypothetical protein [Chloroflexota bacterium]
MIHRANRRRLGVGLVVFGATGLLLVIAGAALVLSALGSLGDAASGFERQRTQAVAMLGPASAALSHAATSATNASASLTETSAAADQAAQLTTRLANSFDGLAALGSFDILGSHPFGQVSSQFAGVASDARTLSTNLSSAAARMRTNVADSAAVATDLQSLAGQLDQLRASLDESASAEVGAVPAATLPIDAARIVLIGLLAWFAVPAIASLWLGSRLLRIAPRGTARS